MDNIHHISHPSAIEAFRAVRVSVINVSNNINPLSTASWRARLKAQANILKHEALLTTLLTTPLT